MSYDFEKYNDGEPFDFRQEKWMEEAEKIDDELFCLDKTITTEEYIETSFFIILGT